MVRHANRGRIVHGADPHLDTGRHHVGSSRATCAGVALIVHRHRHRVAAQRRGVEVGCAEVEHALQRGVDVCHGTTQRDGRVPVETAVVSCNTPGARGYLHAAGWLDHDEAGGRGDYGLHSVRRRVRVGHSQALDVQRHVFDGGDRRRRGDHRRPVHPRQSHLRRRLRDTHVPSAVARGSEVGHTQRHRRSGAIGVECRGVAASSGGRR